MAHDLPCPFFRFPQDQLAAMDVGEGNQVRVIFSKTHHSEAYETVLTSEAARVLGEQLMLASRASETWEKPLVRVDFDREMIEEVLRKHLKEILKL